jgi:hypothetical protein
MKIIYNDKPISTFNFWGPAEHNAKKLVPSQFEILEEEFAVMYPDGIDAGKLNDIFAYNFEIICEMLGIKDPDADDELEDFETNLVATYEVWALGYNDENEITDCELLLADFKDAADAVAFAEKADIDLCLQAVANLDNPENFADVVYFQIEIQTVVPCVNEEDGTENIASIYERIIEL